MNLFAIDHDCRRRLDAEPNAIALYCDNGYPHVSIDHDALAEPTGKNQHGILLDTGPAPIATNQSVCSSQTARTQLSFSEEAPEVFLEMPKAILDHLWV